MENHANQSPPQSRNGQPYLSNLEPYLGRGSGFDAEAIPEKSAQKIFSAYVERKDISGPERTFANSYRPGEDIIRYNYKSNVHKVNVGQLRKSHSD